jgi:hypothetical protein
LEDGSIVEAVLPQVVHVLTRDACGVFRDLHDKIEHRALRLGDGSSAIVRAKLLDQRFVQRDPTQKLCV